MQSKHQLQLLGFFDMLKHCLVVDNQRNGTQDAPCMRHIPNHSYHSSNSR